MLTTIYFVRHGHVENKDGIIYGRLQGFNLSNQGREEAELAANYLKDKDISNIYTSPLERCSQTAEIIGSLIKGIKIEPLLGLTEVDASRWQGKPWAHMIEIPDYERLINDPDDSEISENLVNLAKRVKSVVDRVLTENKGGNVVCVSHEFPILALKLKLENKPLITLKTLSVKTGGMVKFVFDEENKLVSSEAVSFPGV